METRLKDITAVVNHKGGVAKTTTVLSLAGGLLRQHKGARVLVIDMDPQGCLSEQCGWDAQDGTHTIYSALSKEGKGRGIPVYKSEQGFYYTPSEEELVEVVSDLKSQMIPGGVLWDRLSHPVEDHTGDGLTNIVESFDYILIDCAPDMSEVTNNAIVVASRILVPVQPGPMPYKGLASLMKRQTEIDVKLRRLLMGDDYEPLEVRIVPTMTGGNARIHRGYMHELQEKFGRYLTSASIRRDVKMEESQGLLVNIFQRAPYCRVAIDYEQLVKELYN